MSHSRIGSLRNRVNIHDIPESCICFEGSDTLPERAHILRVGPFSPGITTKDLQNHFAKYKIKFRIKWYDKIFTLMHQLPFCLYLSLLCCRRDDVSCMVVFDSALTPEQRSAILADSSSEFPVFGIEDPQDATNSTNKGEKRALEGGKGENAAKRHKTGKPVERTKS